ncbi:MAG: terminase small subunit [Gammaproteobacteria bacterium]|nr:terminase small subunit [Gammaproteobacteria bacterium]
MTLAPTVKVAEKHWLSQVEMLRSLNITKQAFARWNVPHVAVVGKRRYYTAEAVLHNRLTHQEAKSKKLLNRKDAIEQLDAAKLLEVQERTENIALKNAILKREHAPIAMLEWMLGQVGSQISAILESIPVKVKRRMPHLKTSELQILKEEIVKCQNVAAEAHVDLDAYESG